MKKFGVIAALALVVAPTAVAGPAPNAADRAAAVRDCRMLRQAPPAGMGLALFRQTYGTNANRMNAFGMCLSKWGREERQNRLQAAAECREERGATAQSRAAFRQKYGTFGRCVREKRNAESADDRADTMNAAQTCDTERGETAASRAAFNEKYGRSENDRNAFGKCVSQTARAQDGV